MACSPRRRGKGDAEVSRADLLRQCASASAEVRKLKRACPNIFPQYAELIDAQNDLHRAKERLRVAKDAWDAFGRLPKDSPK